MVSAAGKRWRAYPLDPRPDAVALYSGYSPETRKLIAPELSQTYAQIAKPSIATTTTQTDENITKIVCPPLKLLQPAQFLPSTSSVAVTTSSESHPPIPLFTSAPSTSNSLLDSVAFSSSNQTLPPSTCPMFTALSTVTSPSVSEPTTSISNSLPSTTTSAVSEASKSL
ncbi:hypothetical protein TNCV_3229721 [Trichonephila clavipes]|nr:hypothetical protein TNCV_3229721 [Trichonephila clavipes]